MQEPVDPTQLDDLDAWIARNAAGRDEANRRARAELVEARAAIARIDAAVTTWEAELKSRAIRDPDARHCWSLAASEIRTALEPRP